MNALKTAFFLGLLSALIVAIGGALGGRSGMIVALGLAAAMNFFSYWFSDRLVLAMHKDMPTVPARTVQQGPDGYFAFVVKPDQTVERRDDEELPERDDTPAR